MARVGRNRGSRPPRRLVIVAVAVVALAAMSACAPAKKGAPQARVLLVGDSVAVTLAESLNAEFAVRGRSFDSAAVLGCGIVRGVYTDFANNLLEGSVPCANAIWGLHDSRIESYRPNVVLWLSIFEEFGRRVDNAWYIPGPWPAEAPNGITGAAADAKLLDLMEEKRAQLTRDGAKLVILTSPPPPGDQHAGTGGHQERIVHMNDLLRQFVVANPGTTALIEFDKIVCPPSGVPPCPTNVAGIQLRPDGYHFSDAGARWAASQIVPVL
jgi:hypothetical protein